MPSTKKNPEIEALEAAYGALKDLAPDIRMKVLKGVFALLGIDGMQAEAFQEQQSLSMHDRIIPSGTTHPPAQVSEGAETRRKSLVELVLDKRPQTNIERIALFAYYREKYEGLSRFGRSDLESYFAKAKVIPPKNYNRDFTEAVKKGWIHEDGSDSYITSRGIEAVESGFDSEQRTKRPKSRPSDKKTSKSKKGIKKGRSKP